MSDDMRPARPDPTGLWRDADALYRAAARAAAWCRSATAEHGLRTLLTEALPSAAEQRERVARALEVPATWIERLTRAGADPVTAPAPVLAALARGLRVDPALFWQLAQRDHAAVDHSVHRRGPGIFRSASARPTQDRARDAERAFHDAWAREWADAPSDDDLTDTP